MARPESELKEYELFASLRKLLAEFMDIPEHRPCADSECIYCKKVEGRRVFDLLRSLGRYLQHSDVHS